MTPAIRPGSSIRLGIVGCNFGRSVLLPAFRLDPRCRVVAIAGTDAVRAAKIAQVEGIDAGYGSWQELVQSSSVDAIAIATPPHAQPEIACAALALGKPVFAEKPMAATLEGAQAMLDASGNVPTATDFEFSALPAWRKVREMVAADSIGALRQITVTWHIETVSTRLRIKNWKTSLARGGGALGNLASHALHYLEWLGGPISGLSARLAGLPDAPDVQTAVVFHCEYASGATGSFSLNCGVSPGSGHRVELYGETGALILANATRDYMRGFTVLHGARGDDFHAIPVEADPLDAKFPGESRIAPVSRLATGFLDGIEGSGQTGPGFAEGYRVQVLLDAICRSHESGRWIGVDRDR